MEMVAIVLFFLETAPKPYPTLSPAFIFLICRMLALSVPA
jgi:hypothetical protein